MLQEEAQWLVQRGLGTRATYSDLLVFDNDGPIENELRFDDECVRHKTLDLVGDLRLPVAMSWGTSWPTVADIGLMPNWCRMLLNEEEIIDGRRKSA